MMTDQTNKPKAAIVEDNLDLSNAFGQALEEAGYVVKRFADPKIALAYVKDHAPRLLLLDLDLKMPGIDEVVEFIHTSPDHDAVQIILTTAQERMARKTKTGQEIILLKPIRYSQLVTFARRLLPNT